MIKRSITGLFIAMVFVAVVVCSTMVHYMIFDAFCLVVMVGGAYEVCKAIKNRYATPFVPLVLATCILGYLVFFGLNWLGFLPSTAIAGFYAVTILSLGICALIPAFSKNKPSFAKDNSPTDSQSKASDVSSNIASNDKFTSNDSASNTTTNTSSARALAADRATSTQLCLLYPATLIVFMMGLNYLNVTFREVALILLFTVTPLTDVMAYLVGSTLRGKKLCPKISPKKTISGAIGGLVGGLIGGGIIIILATVPAFGLEKEAAWLGFSDTQVVIHSLILGFVGSICTQSGDILASFVKRKCQIKDYGKFLPGHGGIMDRVDGMIINAVFLFLYIFILSRLM